MRIENERTINYLAYVLILILLISMFMWLSSCNTEITEVCGTCRTYIYEFDTWGNYRKASITENEFCNDLYKDYFKVDTLENGWFRQTQKECY